MDYTATSSGLTYDPTQTAYQPVTLQAQTSGGNQASVNQSKLMRAQWSDYQKRFAPIEDKLLGQIGNADYYAGQVQNAVNDANASYGTQAGVEQRNLSRYGVQQDPAQEASQNTQYGLNQAAAMAQAANQTRQGLKQRDLQVMGGGIVPSQVANSNTATFSPTGG